MVLSEILRLKICFDMNNEFAGTARSSECVCCCIAIYLKKTIKQYERITGLTVEAPRSCEVDNKIVRPRQSPILNDKTQQIPGSSDREQQ
jgi:hypothetical protein